MHVITAHLCIPYVPWDTQLWCYCLNCIHSTHPGVCYLHHSLNPSSLINPNKSQPQAAVSADTIPPALPRSTKAQETVTHTGAVCRESERVVEGGKRGVGLNREAGDGGQERGDSLGREPIQLQAAVQPWFLWRHLIRISMVSSPLSWYPFLLSLPFPYTFFSILLSWHTLMPPKYASPHNTKLTFLIYLSILALQMQKEQKGIGVNHHWSILSPYRCVMLQSKAHSNLVYMSRTTLPELISLLQESCSRGSSGHPIPLRCLWHLREWKDKTLNVNTYIF